MTVERYPRRHFLGAMGALAAVSALPGPAWGYPPVGDGSPLPDITLSWLDGRSFRLAQEVSGKVVLINFWATWCGPCLMELPALDGLHRKLKGNPKVELLAVNVDQGLGMSMLNQFWSRYKLDLPSAYDPAGLASRVFRLSALPMSFVVDVGGDVRYAITGSRNWESEQWVRGLESMAAEDPTAVPTAG